MFDMKKVGRNIALLRKENNLTQMELADKLNISFQAVSSWERGETMPDISKLPELSTLLNSSIDDILGNKRKSEILEDIIDGRKIASGISNEDFTSIAPLLKPTQIEEVSNNVEIDDEDDDLIGMLPFLSSNKILMIAQKKLSESTIDFADFLPFMNMNDKNTLVSSAIEKGYTLGDLDDCLPFLNSASILKLALNSIEKGDADLECIFPFMNKSDAFTLVSKIIEENLDIDKIIDFIPLLSRESNDMLVTKAIELGYGRKALKEFIPFISSDMVIKLMEID